MVKINLVKTWFTYLLLFCNLRPTFAKVGQNHLTVEFQQGLISVCLCFLTACLWSAGYNDQSDKSISISLNFLETPGQGPDVSIILRSR